MLSGAASMIVVNNGGHDLHSYQCAARPKQHLGLKLIVRAAVYGDECLAYTVCATWPRIVTFRPGRRCPAAPP